MNGILCFGDSIVFGKGSFGSEGWVGFLRRDFEKKDEHNAVFNLGYSGNNTKQLLDRFKTDCDTRIIFKRPTDKYSILISIGTNDARCFDTWDNPNIEPDTYRTNIQKLITLGKTYKANLCFIGLIPLTIEKGTIFNENTLFSNERMKKYNDIAKEECAKENVPFLDHFNNLNSDEWDSFLFDGLHPNQTGYEKMYSYIKPFLAKLQITE